MRLPKAPWAAPTMMADPMPVGTSLASSRSGRRVLSVMGGAAASSESATGATDNVVKMATTAKPMAVAGCTSASRSGPSPQAPLLTSMYTASNRPRASLVTSWFSHDSATTYCPARHSPVMKRITTHTVGLGASPSSNTLADRIDAERGEHPDVAHLRQRQNGQLRADQEPAVVGGADEPDDAGAEPFELGANRDEGRQQAGADEQQRQADEQGPGGPGERRRERSTVFGQRSDSSPFVFVDGFHADPGYRRASIGPG